MTQHGTHDYVDDPRNADVFVSVNGVLKRRAEATVSVFDAGFVLGDGIWEGLRVHGGRLAFLDQHLDRLYEGAKAIALDIGRTRAELEAAVYGWNESIGSNAIEVHIHSLRRKLAPGLIVTLRGIGYQLGAL